MIYNKIHNISVETILLVKEFFSINLYASIIIVFLLIIPRILFNTTYFCLNDKIIYGFMDEKIDFFVIILEIQILFLLKGLSHNIII